MWSTDITAADGTGRAVVQPLDDAVGMEEMATGLKLRNLLVVFPALQADCTRVSAPGQHNE